MGKKSSPTRRRDRPALPKARIVNKDDGRKITITRNPPPDGLGTPRIWHLVFTQPRMEAKVKKALEEAGCVTFWPSEHFRVEHPRRKPIDYDVGLYPRYLFFSGTVFRERRVDRVIDGSQVVTVNGRPVDDIQDIDGVNMVVSNSGRWVRIPQRAIEIMAGVQKGSLKPRSRFEMGQTVLIGAGPLMGLKATIVEVLGVEQARMVIDALAGNFSATLDLADIRAA